MNKCFAIELKLENGDIEVFYVGADTFENSLRLIHEGHHAAKHSRGNLTRLRTH